MGLGATGDSGQHFVRQGLAAGHTIRALVRNPDKLDQKFQTEDNFSIVPNADTFSADDLAKAFEGADAVVSCLGTRPNIMPWGNEITLYSESIKAIVAAMRKANVNRLVTMTSMFTDDDPAYGFFVRWILKPLFIGRNLDDMARMEKYLEEECQDIKEAIGCQTITGTQAGKPMQRGDVARFILKALTCGTYDRQMVAVATFDGK